NSGVFLKDFVKLGKGDKKYDSRRFVKEMNPFLSQAPLPSYVYHSTIVHDELVLLYPQGGPPDEQDILDAGQIVRAADPPDVQQET
ncbi:hypothetical protein EGW08_012547, partial [Elysia chlorotica]